MNRAGTPHLDAVERGQALPEGPTDEAHLVCCVDQQLTLCGWVKLGQWLMVDKPPECQLCLVMERCFPLRCPGQWTSTDGRDGHVCHVRFSEPEYHWSDENLNAKSVWEMSDRSRALKNLRELKTTGRDRPSDVEPTQNRLRG